MKILIVEDELKLLMEMKEYLEGNGFTAIAAKSISEASDLVKNAPDLVLLDWRLPDGEGIDLLQGWRKSGLEIPVVMMTAKSGIVDKVLGLEMGADDYITKPFEPRELLARIRVQKRKLLKVRSAGDAEVHDTSVLRSADIELNQKTRQVAYRGNRVELAKLEFDLLKLFLERPNEALSRLEIMNGVWGRDNYQSTKTIEFHVASLRKKIAGRLFEAVRGVGYIFKPSGTGVWEK